MSFASKCVICGRLTRLKSPMCDGCAWEARRKKLKTARRVTAGKYQGDDEGSWAVFIDGRPFVTGLTRSEVPYYKDRALEQLQKAGA